MSIYSYVLKRNEDGAWTGVPRFDITLRRALPGLISVTACPGALSAEDRVIADNHLSCDVPADVRTIVVHHGCARTHYDRDPYWRTTETQKAVQFQTSMFELPNRLYVAPSAWVAEQFEEVRTKAKALREIRNSLIPHWVEYWPLKRAKQSRPVIIGDWRDWNKGNAAAKRLAQHCPQWEFRALSFKTAEEKIRQYSEASLYLCLSLSEGAPYAVADAEAFELPIVTTDVGNYREFSDCEVISWRARDNAAVIAGAIERKLRAGRNKGSFYQTYSFESWRQAWENVIK